MDASALKQPGVWNVSVQLVVLYCVAVALFYAIHAVTRRVKHPAASFPLSAAFYAAGVAALAYACGQVKTAPRLAMVAAPLVLAVEAHVRAARAEPAGRAAALSGLAGAVLGMAGAAFALMRDAPLK
jgi:hypothetical protein